MKYKSSNNSLDVHCAECGDDITLSAQYLDGKRGVILCGTCNEEYDDEKDPE